MSFAQQLLLPERPLLGIAGCSGSGKTTLARELTSQFNATLLPLDHPNSLEIEMLIDHIHHLANGQPIERPVYDFSTHTRLRGRTETVAPAKVLIVEGILALHYPDLLALRLQHLEVVNNFS